MIDPQKELEWLTGQLGKLYAESAERLSPEGSSPASCSRSRVAVEGHDATTRHTTARAFPDRSEDRKFLTLILGSPALVYAKALEQFSISPSEKTSEALRKASRAMERAACKFCEFEGLTESDEERGAGPGNV